MCLPARLHVSQGGIVLTVVYSLLFFYTLLVTIGPLALHYWIDPMQWCPYYYHDESWDEESHNHNNNGSKEKRYSLDIDQLQQTRHELNNEQYDGDGQANRSRYKRRMLSHGKLPKLVDLDIDLLQRTSNDVHRKDDGEVNSDTIQYENPDYNDSPCHTSRLPSLFYLTLEECDLSRRMYMSVIFGGFIGYERRASDRPAGIRTMALVALGSCFFTLSSQLAFRDSPMTWDSSRVSAAIPSGVGFLGAGLIWKGSLNDGKGGEVHQVHGITTAASLWLAAAVGVGAGGALYAVTAYSTALVILVLRFGPRLYFQSDRGFADDEYEEESDDEDSDAEECANFQKETPSQPNHEVALESGAATLGQQYEMHELSKDSQMTEAKKDKGYGSTDERGNDKTVAQLLQENQIRQLHRLNQTQATNNSQQRSNSNDNPFLAWLGKLLPGNKDRHQPENPYQEFSRDREIMRMMKKKKSMGRMSSRPSFCT